MSFWESFVGELSNPVFEPMSPAASPLLADSLPLRNHALSFFYRLCPAHFPSISVWVTELHLADSDLKIPVPRPVSS